MVHKPENELTRLLRTVIEKGASDIHLSHNAKITYRIDGVIHQIGQIIKGEQIFGLAKFAISSEQQKDFYRDKSVDFSYQVDGVRFRGNLIFQKGQPACVMRKINAEVIPIDELGLPAVLKEMANLSWGMILVTGPTGSGKSTTLASVVDYINENKSLHITTIEEPVEYVHENKKSIVTQREVGRDSSSFAESMRTSLRLDPDVILVGEMRDLETVSAAVTNAETGHLVLGTLHTNNAPQTIQRIADMYPHEQQDSVRAQLANNLKLVVNQRLVAKEGGGRKAIYEVMVIDEEIRDLIRERRDKEIHEVMRRKPEKGNMVADFS